MDVMERTLAQEKNRYDKFCRMMHVLSTLLCILFTAGAVFCLIASTVQFINFRNQGGETNTVFFLVPVFYLFLVLGGGWPAMEFRTSCFPPPEDRRNAFLL